MNNNVPKRHIIPLFLPHSGCPHQCSFCNQKLITGQSPSLPQTSVLQKQIEEFLSFKGKRRSLVQIAFYGGNFLGLKKDDIRSLLQLASEYVHGGDADSIRFSTRPDTITYECMEILNGFPVKTIELGAQSMDDAVLKMASRGHSAEDTEEAVSYLKERNYEIGLQMMVGLPGENESSAMYSAERIALLRPDLVRIYPAIVLKGSRLGEWYQHGQYSPLSLEAAVSRVKAVFLLFKKNHIPVVRMGLQPTEELDSESTVLAGPYHPAFGELVYSSVFFDMAKELLESIQPQPDNVTLSVHPKSVSKVRGTQKPKF